MDSLVKEGRGGVLTVNARDLWEMLESKQDFSTWIKNRIEKYGFVEGLDYTIHKVVERVNGNNGGGAVTKSDYHLTINTAKELAMVENTDKGREVRRYFIDVESAYFGKKKLRDKSKRVRNEFTDTLKDHGCSQPHHFINITGDMKETIGIPRHIKKDQFTVRGLRAITACEALASLQLDIHNANGYNSCRNISVDACIQVKEITKLNQYGRIENNVSSNKSGAKKLPIN